MGTVCSERGFTGDVTSGAQPGEMRENRCDREKAQAAKPPPRAAPVLREPWPAGWRPGRRGDLQAGPPRLFLSCRLSALSRFTWRLCERGALCWVAGSCPPTPVARPHQGSLPPRAQSPGDRDQETWLQGRSLTLGPQPCPRLLCERPRCREACAVSAVPLRGPSASPTGEESKAISKPVGGRQCAPRVQWRKTEESWTHALSPSNPGAVTARQGQAQGCL